MSPRSTTGGTLWYLTRFDDVQAGFQHHVQFSGAQVSYNVDDTHQWIPAQVDPPNHTKYRVLLNRLFSAPHQRRVPGDILTAMMEVVATTNPAGGKASKQLMPPVSVLEEGVERLDHVDHLVDHVEHHLCRRTDAVDRADHLTDEVGGQFLRPGPSMV